jgi:hypothetical protein
VTPVVYTYFDELMRRVRRGRGATDGGASSGASMLRPAAAGQPAAAAVIAPQG